MENELVSGKFTKVLSGGNSVDWKYTLALFKTSERKDITIFLTNTIIVINKLYNIKLKPNPNEKYKDTFHVDVIEEKTDFNNNEVYKLIENNCKGIGKKTLQKIEEITGLTIKELLNEPKKILVHLKDKQKESFEFFVDSFFNKENNFFIVNNLSLLQKKLKIIFSEHANNLLDFLKTKNIYKLYWKYDLPFEEVDLLASKLIDNFTESMFIRQEAVVIYSFRLLWEQNNTVFSIVDLWKNYKDKFSAITQQQYYETIERMILEKTIIYYPEIQKFTLSAMFEKENFIFNKLLEISKNPVFQNNKSIENGLSQKQKSALWNALGSAVSIISGFPGTGKTHLIKTIYDNLVANKNIKEHQIALLTPTGRAATNIIFRLGLEAKTIHSFLKISSTDYYAINNSNLNNENIKILIIDEFSMVNINLFYLLLKNCPNLKKIILIGDHNQLPCIGPGNMLEELIESNIFPTTILDEVFRTDHQDIVDHFLKIKANETPILNSKSVNFYKTNNDNFLKDLKDFFLKEVNKKSIDNVFILIPLYHKKFGILNVNNYIQKYLLDTTQSKYMEIKNKDESIKFFEGDRVINNKNDYEKNIFNGEIGIVISIDNKKMQVQFPMNKIVEYQKDEIREYLNLGYAITIHKFQGSDASTIIFPIMSDYSFMLSKKLMYTAVSRTKDNLILCGNAQLYLDKIISSNIEPKIITNLKLLIENYKK